MWNGWWSALLQHCLVLCRNSRWYSGRMWVTARECVCDLSGYQFSDTWTCGVSPLHLCLLWSLLLPALGSSKLAQSWAFLSSLCATVSSLFTMRRSCKFVSRSSALLYYLSSLLWAFPGKLNPSKLLIFATFTLSIFWLQALTLANSSRRNYTTGEIVNLMSADAQQLMELTVNINLLWSAPFQIIMAVVFLWKELGSSALAGVAVLLLVIPINALIAAKVKSLKVRHLNRHGKERFNCRNAEMKGGGG